jgi:hypothetical protein
MKLDVYVWQARRSAVTLTALPLALAMFAWSPRFDWALLAPPLTFCGVFGLVSQIGRDKGKLKEDRLYTSWGGKPTTVMLRHRDSPLDPSALALLHAALARVTGVPAPSKRKEAGSPVTADKVYDEYVRYLRDSTRDREKYPRIFEELVNFGFRRNLWGLKPIGIVIATVASVAAIGAVCWHHGRDHQPLAGAAAVVNVIMLAAWLLWINPAWVRIAAQAYAERLIEVALRDGRPSKPPVEPKPPKTKPKNTRLVKQPAHEVERE